MQGMTNCYSPSLIFFMVSLKLFQAQRNAKESDLPIKTEFTLWKTHKKLTTSYLLRDTLQPAETAKRKS